MENNLAQCLLHCANALCNIFELIISKHENNGTSFTLFLNWYCMYNVVVIVVWLVVVEINLIQIQFN